MSSPADTLTATFQLRWEGQTLETEVTVPAGRVSPRIVLPQVRQFADNLIGLGIAATEARGESVSCRVGCAACCRHLVPLAESEARHLADVTRRLPQPLRDRVHERFVSAKRRLIDTTLMATLEAPAQHDTTEAGVAYLRLAIDCPFLEEEQCVIYQDRPFACREYLVTSPAENCQNPTPETIRRLPTPGWVMASFATLDGPPPPGQSVRWVPLVLALDWVESHPEPPDSESGPELFARFMTALTSKRIPPPLEPGVP